MTLATISELGLAFEWFVTTLNADTTINTLPGYGGVFDTTAPQDTTRPFFIFQDMTGSDVNNMSGGKRIKSDLLIKLVAVGESSQAATLETMDVQADYDLTPAPDGVNHFPISFGGGWILSCIRLRPHNLKYLSAAKLYIDRGGIYAVSVKTH